MEKQTVAVPVCISFQVCSFKENSKSWHKSWTKTDFCAGSLLLIKVCMAVNSVTNLSCLLLKFHRLFQNPAGHPLVPWWTCQKHNVGWHGGKNPHSRMGKLCATSVFWPGLAWPSIVLNSVLSAAVKSWISYFPSLFPLLPSIRLELEGGDCFSWCLKWCLEYRCSGNMNVNDDGWGPLPRKMKAKPIPVLTTFCSLVSRDFQNGARGQTASWLQSVGAFHSFQEALEQTFCV